MDKTATLPALNARFHDAGKTFVKKVSAYAGAFAKASADILTNRLPAVRLFINLPETAKQNERGYRQHSFGNRFRPLLNLLSCAVSKAALHSYTRGIAYEARQITIN